MNYTREGNHWKTTSESPASASSSLEMDGSGKQQGVQITHHYHDYPGFSPTHRVKRTHKVAPRHSPGPDWVYKAARPPPAMQASLLQRPSHTNTPCLLRNPPLTDRFAASKRRCDTHHNNNTKPLPATEVLSSRQHGSADTPPSSETAPPRPAKPRPPEPAPPLPRHHARRRAALLPVALRAVLGVAHHGDLLRRAR